MKGWVNKPTSRLTSVAGSCFPTRAAMVTMKSCVEEFNAALKAAELSCMQVAQDHMLTTKEAQVHAVSQTYSTLQAASGS